MKNSRKNIHSRDFDPIFFFQFEILKIGLENYETELLLIGSIHSIE